MPEPEPIGEPAAEPLGEPEPIGEPLAEPSAEPLSEPEPESAGPEPFAEPAPGASFTAHVEDRSSGSYDGITGQGWPTVVHMWFLQLSCLFLWNLIYHVPTHALQPTTSSLATRSSASHTVDVHRPFSTSTASFTRRTDSGASTSRTNRR